ncbi:transposase domain-containing protein [Solibacillus sp. FSL H8-0538]|uniref:transposase domain-containing protein n=1 Tax=Solibacillus sp. FSL H8-0538 TaxID=2921400 RepID=UPI0030FAB627
MNSICLSIVETAKSNGVDFYKYIKNLFTDLPNLSTHQNPEILYEYMPWSKSIHAACSTK